MADPSSLPATLANLDLNTTICSQSQSPLLSLPAEVRNRIYSYTLCPTNIISLTRSPTHRLSITPRLSPQILSTCHQCYHECGRQQSFLFLNEVCLSIDAHDTSWPVISETRLPQHVLERIEHIFLVFDCTGNFRASYKEDVDWTALTALINLKKLRLGVVYSEDYPDELCVEMLEEVLTRLPRDVEVVCGIEEEEKEEWSEQGNFLEGVLKRKRNGRKRPGAVQAMDAETLRVAVAAVDQSKRGTKSGGVEDVFAEYRMESSSIGRRFARQSDFAI